MTPMEEFKLRLQLAAKTKRVRLGQRRDHLIWTRKLWDDDGEPYDLDVYVFCLDSDDNYDVVEVWSGSFIPHHTMESFLDDVYETRQESDE